MLFKAHSPVPDVEINCAEKFPCLCPLSDLSHPAKRDFSGNAVAKPVAKLEKRCNKFGFKLLCVFPYLKDIS